MSEQQKSGPQKLEAIVLGGAKVTFENKDDFLLYVAQITRYSQFVQFHLKAVGTIPGPMLHRRLKEQRAEFLELAERLVCDNGLSLMEQLKRAARLN